jgi:hypothetical protein
MNITTEFKEKVVAALTEQRSNFEGSDAQFAKKWGLNNAVYSRMKNGERERLVADSWWLNTGRVLNVTIKERVWNAARTDVFNQIEEEILFCKQYSKSMIFVDDCEIGKTFAAKYLSRTIKNCFYIDCSQCKARQQFVRTLASVLGIDNTGRLVDVKDNVKYYLRLIENPLIICDEFGDLDYGAFLELKEFWNGTEGVCGWYLIGADGARAKMERGIGVKKVGYRELFSRFSGKFSNIVPTDKHERQGFYKKLINDVLSVNVEDQTIIPNLIRKCLVSDNSGHIGGLRRAESLLILNS